MPTFISLFSGVGGFDLGLEAAGWECVAQVEWDTQCQQVLARHWPDVPRWGDVSTVSGADLPPADVIAFGSPCQDLSVAGKRAGLDGDRSGLFFEAIRIIKEMRNATAGTQPRFVIWENVAGALSSSGGWDFAAVIDSLAELGALDIAWRILDARWFGVPQRRRRVFVIADFAGQCAGAIHAVSPSVPWHPRSSRTTGPVAATGTGTSATPSGEHLSVWGQTQFAGYTKGINTLAATTYKRPNDNIVTPTPTHTRPHPSPRRLTPTECERLMGWPDDHTRWRVDGTELADSVRYRMCGNGVASPVAEWLADMINQALENE